MAFVMVLQWLQDWKNKTVNINSECLDKGVTNGIRETQTQSV